MISVVMVQYNKSDLTKQAIGSFRKHYTGEYEIILVDNNSSDQESREYARSLHDFVFIQNEKNEGFGRANNIGARAARGKYLFFVNNDVIFQNDIVSPLQEFMETHLSAGAVAPMLLNLDGTYQLSHNKYPSIFNELLTKRDTAICKTVPVDRSPKEVEWVSFAAVMIRKSAFERIGGFDERYFMYFEDADVCCRLKKAGYETIYNAEHSLVHIGGGRGTRTLMDRIQIEYRRSQLTFYSSYNSKYETFVLRLYLISRFLFIYVFKRGDERRLACQIIKLISSFHAHRT